jgi:hypothetical protein
MEVRAAREEEALKEFRKAQNTSFISSVDDEPKKLNTIASSVLSIPQKNKESTLSGAVLPVIKGN